MLFFIRHSVALKRNMEHGTWTMKLWTMAKPNTGKSPKICTFCISTCRFEGKYAHIGIQFKIHSSFYFANIFQPNGKRDINLNNAILMHLIFK